MNFKEVSRAKKAVILVLSLFFAVSCTKKNKETEETQSKKPLVKHEVNMASPMFMLPENTDLIVQGKSLSSIYNDFLIKENSMFMQELRGAEKRDLNEMKEIFQINPLNLKDFASIGIDVEKPLGFALHDTLLQKYDLALNLIFYAPLKDEKKVKAYIEGLFENGEFKNKKIKVYMKKEGNHYVFSGKNPKELIHAVIKNGYIFAIVNPENPEATKLASKQILTGKQTLTQDPVFKAEASFLKSEEGVYVYGNVKNFLQTNKAFLQKELKRDGMSKLFSLFQSYQSLSFNLALNQKDFMLKANASMVKDSVIANFLKKMKAKMSPTPLHVDLPALLYIGYNLDMKSYLEIMMSMVEDREQRQFDKALAEAKKETGIDIQKDILENLTGLFSLTTYDGSSITNTNYNSLMTIGLNDPKRMEGVFDKLLKHKEFEKMKKFVSKIDYKGKPVYKINAMVTQVYIGFTKSELVVASGKNIYDLALDKKETKNTKANQKHLDPQTALYFSFLESMKALQNFKGLIPQEAMDQAKNILELLDYLKASFLTNENTMQITYLLKTNLNENFFPFVIKKIASFNK